VAGHSAGAQHHGTLLGYMRHPLVGAGLFLEHGCEKTHNDYMRHELEAGGAQAARYGWASVQLDGGLAAVLDKIEAWFAGAVAAWPPPEEEQAGLEAVRLGLQTAGPVAAPLAEALARLTRIIVGAGGLVVAPQTASLLAAAPCQAGTLGGPAVRSSLGYGQAADVAGFHLMQSPSTHWVENLTGLGATGVEVVLAVPGPRPAQGHPLVPLLQVGVEGEALATSDFDLILGDEPGLWAEQMLARVAATLARRYVPRRLQQGLVDFQLTRGLLGVSV
jgi:altronate dehydratase